MTEFTKVLAAADLQPGRSACVDFAGKRVVLFNVGGTIYAIADTCTHRGGSLSQGEVAGTEVTCPLHGAVFDLATGDAKGPPATAGVACYAVRVESGEIQLAAH